MRTSIDKAGRVVIPKELRDRLGFTGGEVEIHVSGNGFQIEPVVEPARLVESNGRLVIESDEAPLTVEEEREFLEALRDKRVY